MTSWTVASLATRAERDGIRLRWRDLGRTRRGEYVADLHLITLNLGMSTAVELSTLAHEMGHAHYRHRGVVESQERQADRWAARLLVTADDLREAERMAGSHPGALARELGVSRWVVEAAWELHSRGIA